VPLLLAMLAFGAGCWFFAHRDIPVFFWSADEYEFAEIGRRIASGQGFTSGVIYPPHLDYGVSQDHPSLVRPPLWPLMLAAGFVVAGPEPWVVHAVVLLFFAGTVVLATALATRLAGRLAGALAGVAVATAPVFQWLSLGGLSETSHAFWTLLAFLLCATRARPVWTGIALGLGYLTRYNGIALAPVIALWLLIDTRRWQPLAWCAAGFVAVALPWWLHNFVITGRPFYSLLNVNLYMAPFVRLGQTSLIYQVEPDFASATAMHPLEKARLQLPILVRHWPLASVNLAACVGVALGCVRRDRASLAFAIFALGTTVGLAFALALGRYFVPLVPLLLVLGVAGWMRFGGRLRVPGLALLLAAPLLPAIPATAPDLALARDGVALARSLGAPPPAVQRVRAAAEAARKCLSPGSLVVGESVSPLVWETGTLAIYLPSTREDFWDIVDSHPVDFVNIRQRRWVGRRQLARRFVARPDCGEHLYERRDAPGS
jgi:hypothetical protein